MATLVVREMRGDGRQEVYMLRAEEFRPYEFQMWMMGYMTYGDTIRALDHGGEANEILAYYPDAVLELAQRLDDPLANPYHAMWADPDGMPSRYGEDNR